MGEWAVAVVKTGHERRVAQRFVDNGIEHFLPLIRRRKSTLPMFPSYMFTEVSKGFRQILITSGVLDFIKSSNQQPAVFNDTLVDAIRIRCGSDGVELIERPGFVVGQKVHVNEGVFWGWQGTIGQLSDQGRVHVLLMIMGRAVRVRMHEDALTAA